MNPEKKVISEKNKSINQYASVRLKKPESLNREATTN
jgi:hypothetical protein